MSFGYLVTAGSGIPGTHNMIRLILDVFITISEHLVLLLSVLFLSMLILDSHLGLDRRFRQLCRNRGSLLIFLSLFLFVGIFLGLGLWYLNLPGYAEEVEPMISSVSWLMNHGKPLYHDINSPQRYSVLYGPSVFLTNGLFLQLFDANLATTKAPSFLAGILGLAFLYGALARSKSDKTAALAVILAIFYYWNQEFSIYVVRPDAFLVLAVCFGLLVLTRSKKLLAAVAMGSALGYAINLKIHAGLYFIPLLVLFQQKNGWRYLAATLTAGVFLTLAPFLFHPQISWVNYTLWLKNAAGHGLGMDTISSTFSYALVLVVPLVLVMIMSGNSLKISKSDKILFASIFVSFLGILILSCKPGAGLVHLLPLVPVMVFITAGKAQALNNNHWSQIEASSRNLFIGRCGVVALFMAIFFTGSIHAYRSTGFIKWENRNSKELTEDIDNILNKYSDLKICMACGGEDEFFRSTWMRPLLVFAENPLLIDPIAVMDCRKAGLEISEGTFKAIKNGKVSMWLVPRNQQPFQKTNWYPPHEGIFPKRFLKVFTDNYSKLACTRYFDLWFWDGLQIDPAARKLAAGGSAGIFPDGKTVQ